MSTSFPLIGFMSALKEPFQHLSLAAQLTVSSPYVAPVMVTPLTPCLVNPLVSVWTLA